MKLLLLYRTLAYVTGVLLVVLVFFAVPMEFAFGHPVFDQILGFAHGWLYMVYVVVTLLLSLRQKWSIAMTVLVALAGTIPFAAFFAEHRVMALANAKAAAPEGAAARA